MAGTVDISIERNTSRAMKITCNMDFTGWGFVYLVKTNANEPDSQAIISSVVPTIIEETVNGTPIKKILVSFKPSDTYNIPAKTYLHGLRAISANKETVIPLFTGKLTITENFIQAPIEVTA